MPSIAGRKCTISTSATDGSYNALTGIATMSGGGPTAAPIDDAEFGIEWMQKITGILDNKLSFSGGFRADDSTGQLLIRGAMVAGTTVWIKVLFDGTTNGWKQEMMCSKFATSGDVKDRIKVDIDMEGTGAMTFLP